MRKKLFCAVSICIATIMLTITQQPTANAAVEKPLGFDCLKMGHGNVQGEIMYIPRGHSIKIVQIRLFTKAVRLGTVTLEVWKLKGKNTRVGGPWSNFANGKRWDHILDPLSAYIPTAGKSGAVLIKVNAKPLERMCPVLLWS